MIATGMYTIILENVYGKRIGQIRRIIYINNDKKVCRVLGQILPCGEGNVVVVPNRIVKDLVNLGVIKHEQ